MTNKKIIAIAERLYPDITTDELNHVLNLVGPSAKTNAEILVEYAMGRVRSVDNPSQMIPVFGSILEKRFKEPYKVTIMPVSKTPERKVIDTILSVYECDYMSMLSGVREHPYPDLIKTVSFILHDFYHFNNTEIAKMVNRDRSTVSQSIKEHGRIVDFDRRYKQRVIDCLVELGIKKR